MKSSEGRPKSPRTYAGELIWWGKRGFGINPSSEVSFATLSSTIRTAGRHPSSGLSADGAGEIVIFLQVTI